MLDFGAVCEYSWCDATAGQLAADKFGNMLDGRLAICREAGAEGVLVWGISETCCCCSLSLEPLDAPPSVRTKVRKEKKGKALSSYIEYTLEAFPSLSLSDKYDNHEHGV